jgi:hypothetical protein
MTTGPDDAAMEHINPATGWIETSATPDDPAAETTSPATDAGAELTEEHINPATGFIETVAHEE